MWRFDIHFPVEDGENCEYFPFKCGEFSCEARVFANRFEVKSARSEMDPREEQLGLYGSGPAWTDGRPQSAGNIPRPRTHSSPLTCWDDLTAVEIDEK